MYPYALRAPSLGSTVHNYFELGLGVGSWKLSSYKLAIKHTWGGKLYFPPGAFVRQYLAIDLLLAIAW